MGYKESQSKSPKGAKSPKSPKDKVAKMSKKKSNEKNRAPRQDSPAALDPRNFTTFREDQKDWSWENLPDILYQFKPTEGDEKKGLPEPPMMSHEIHGKVLREIPILPDNISSVVEEFRVEAWMRMDRRIRLNDITDRMHKHFRIHDNALQQRGGRFRQACGIIAWSSGNKQSLKFETDLIAQMIQKDIDPALNSTRGITPGLINPDLGEAGGRIPLPDSFTDDKRAVRARKSTKRTRSTKSRPNVEVSGISSPEVSSTLSPASSPAPSSLFSLELWPKSSPESSPEPAPELPSKLSLEPYLESTPEVSFEHSPKSPCLHEPQFVPFEEDLDSVDGPLPAIRGAIPDDELPITVYMPDLELTLGMTNPTPCSKEHDVLRAIVPSSIQHNRPAINMISDTTKFEGLYNKFSQNSSIQTIVNIIPIVQKQEKNLTPSEVHPLIWPYLLPGNIPEETRAMIYEGMLNAYYVGERYLFEMPYLHEQVCPELNMEC